MASTSASTRYIGYVGGVAVAAGVGAAIAVAGQGTAHADSTDSGAKSSTSSTSNAKTGPKRSAAKRVKPAKPQTNVKDKTEKPTGKLETAAARVTQSVSAVSTSISDSLTKAAKPVTPATPVAVKPKPSAEEFEAEQVTKLKSLFTPKQAAAPEPAPAPTGKALAAPTAAPTAAATTDSDTAQPWNPLRPNDQEPDPTDFPDSVMALRDALMNLTPEALDPLDPLIREATEQIYRGSQIVPWVNAVIPISKILPALAPGLGDDAEGDRARQTIINELIKTTPPGSLLYYGYDIVADLINQEEAGQKLKEQIVGTVWDLLDPFQLAHVTGESGIGRAAGSS